MKDSAKNRIVDIEGNLEELDRLAANMTEDGFSLAFNTIRTKAEDGDSESIRTIGAMSAFHNALQGGEAMEEIFERSEEQPELQQIIIDYIHAMRHIISASKLL
jgi:hypothetical protein